MELSRRKFTLEQYHKMIEFGILTEEDRVELIRGEIIEMWPIRTKNATCMDFLNQLLSSKLQDRVLITIQRPVELNHNSETQPDIVLLQPRDDLYVTAHPQPQDILLLIEVAELTVLYDRQEKIPLYAEANIAEVWLIDINEQIVEVYQQPTVIGYQHIEKFTLEQTLSIQAFPEINITVSEIFS